MVDAPVASEPPLVRIQHHLMPTVTRSNQKGPRKTAIRKSNQKGESGCNNAAQRSRERELSGPTVRGEGARQWLCRQQV